MSCECWRCRARLLCRLLVLGDAWLLFGQRFVAVESRVVAVVAIAGRSPRNKLVASMWALPQLLLLLLLLPSTLILMCSGAAGAEQDMCVRRAVHVPGAPLLVAAVGAAGGGVVGFDRR